MHTYLKILSAIVLSLLLWSTIAGVSLLLYTWFFSDKIYGGQPDLDIVLLPGVFALVGFVLFGLTGSLLWFILFRIMRKIQWPEFKKHTIAAYCSSLLSPIILWYLYDERDLQRMLSYLGIMLCLIVPIVSMSLHLYRKIYLRDTSLTSSTHS